MEFPYFYYKDLRLHRIKFYAKLKERNNNAYKNVTVTWSPAGFEPPPSPFCEPDPPFGQFRPPH